MQTSLLFTSLHNSDLGIKIARPPELSTIYCGMGYIWPVVIRGGQLVKIPSFTLYIATGCILRPILV